MYCDLVIDHHPKAGKNKAKLEILKPEIGVTSTLLVEYISEARLDFPVNLATALSYVISSETQNLGREATRRDIDTYFTVFVNSSMKKLSQIIHPKLSRAYYITLAKALQKTEFYLNIICSHVGEVPSAEIVSEMADFLLRLERVSWALCTGRFKGQLILSVRTSQTNAQAGNLLKKLVTDPHTVGGHDMIAGGYIPLNEGKKQDYKEI
jgi:nanoRNase/pAp phosphatase (c-di-AMP/oligoRNAs hydrolase)